MKKLVTTVLVLGILFFQVPLEVPKAEAAIGSWIKAATIVPQSATDFSSANFQQSVRNFQAIGGNYVNFVVPYYQSHWGATDIGRGWNTPTDESLVSGIQFAHSLGMKAQISIYLEVHTGQWRAHINPGDRNTWYARYGDVLVHYGRLAQQNGVELYQLGAELIDMTSSVANPDNTARWNGMIDRVRGVYTGPLTYSANRPQTCQWCAEALHIGFWDRMDYVGISAYFELRGDGSVPQLLGSWEAYNRSHISQLQQFGKPVLFTEIGYRSVTGARALPWDYTLSGPYDAEEQVRDYTALHQFWDAQGYMTGIEIWWWSANPGYGGAGNTDYTPQNKPAQETIRQFWGGGGAPPTGGAPPPPPASPPSAPPTTNPPLPSGPIAFSTTGSANPAAPNAGQSTTLSLSVRNAGSAVTGAIVNLEVYNGGTRVFQHFVENQNFSGGETKQFSATWTPGSAGTYALKAGIFNGNWTQNYYWNESVATISAGSVSTLPPPPTTPPPPTIPPPPTNPPSPPPQNPPAPAPSQTIVMVNGYPTINGNFIDCNGNIDNDPSHHTTDPNDTDSGHRVGQNCPSGTLVANFLSGGGAPSPSPSPVPASPPPAPAPAPAPSPAPSPSPAPTTGTIDVWWPTGNAHISGVVPFKVLLQNTDVSQYQMFWQVDGGPLVSMETSLTDYPHKEALVDVSNWKWNGGGPYTLNFVAKDNSGNTISQKSFQIFVP
ncbi:hypothetical protein HYV30_03485 [Candidatus Kaiserbacteria bacterium]|nr:hypothetical protein [Candidatus Kaiserbacteria bacterium]